MPYGTDGAAGNWNWTSIAASSDGQWGGEGAWNAFDNKVGSGDSKWCCNNPSQWVYVQFSQAYVLSHFTITSGNDEILLASSAGKLIRFNESHVRPMGRTARGVRGLRLKKDEKLISLMVGDPDKTILCVSENGYGKKTALEDFPSHNRGGQGVISMKTSERNGSMVSAALVEDEDGIMLISDKGTMIRTTVSQVPTLSRNTQGVKIITPKDGEKLIECVTIPNEEDQEEE